MKYLYFLLVFLSGFVVSANLMAIKYDLDLEGSIPKICFSLFLAIVWSCLAIDECKRN